MPAPIAAQNLVSPHAGVRATITPGDPMSRMMGQYGKGHSFAPAAPPAGDPVLAVPGAKGAAGAVRDARGGVKRHGRQGGLGPGPNGSYGSPRDYGNAGDNS